MAGFDNDVMYSRGVRLEASTSQDIFLMQQTATDVSRINFTGNPNGSVAANPSSFSHDPVSGNVYFKQTGTGNTGWVLIPNSSSFLTQLNGDSGSATPTAGVITIHTNNLAGATTLFAASASQMTLSVNDANANMFVGQNSGTVGNAGTFSTGIGVSAMSSATSGSSNTALGGNALGLLVSGSVNTALGAGAGGSYTTSESSNIVIGNTGTIGDANALRIGTQGSGSGQQNKCFVAGIIGVTTSNTQMVTINSSTGQMGAATVPSGVVTIAGDTGSATGTTITETGVNSGSSVRFSASGSTVSLNVTDSIFNTIIGSAAGNLTLSGSSNVSLGRVTFFSLTSGSENTAVGDASLPFVNSGIRNAAVGAQSLANLHTGNYNACLGYAAGNAYTTSESSNICINHNGVVADQNTLRLGTQGNGAQQQNLCFIAGISGVTVANTTIVTQNSSTTQMGTMPYAEATYTPVLTFGGGSTGITYTTQLGRYTRIGNVVYYSINIVLSSKGSSTGTATISLPIANGGGTLANAACSAFSGVTLDATYNFVGATIQSTSLVLTESSTVAGAAFSGINNTHLSNTASFYFNGFYFTN